MNSQLNRPTIEANLMKALLLLGLMTMSVLCVLANDQVTVKGQLITSGHEVSGVKAIVIQASTTTEIAIASNGRFEVSLSSSEPAKFRFEKVGYELREIIVDLNSVSALQDSELVIRVLKFNVELRPEFFDTPLADCHQAEPCFLKDATGHLVTDSREIPSNKEDYAESSQTASKP